MSIRTLLAERLSRSAETKLHVSVGKRHPYRKTLLYIARQPRKLPKDTRFSPFADTVKELTSLGWVKVSKDRTVRLTPAGKKAFKASEASYTAARTNREKFAKTPRGKKEFEIEKAEFDALRAKRRRSKRK